MFEALMTLLLLAAYFLAGVACGVRGGERARRE